MTVPQQPAATPTAAPPTSSATAAVTADPSAAGRHAAATASSQPDEPSLGSLVSEASTHLSTLIRSEVELAKLELRSSVKNGGVGVGMFAAAAVVLVFSLTFGFLTLAEGLVALGLPRWLAYLVVFVAQLLAVGALAFLGYRKVKKVKAPERTISTSKDTVAYLKSHG